MRRLGRKSKLRRSKQKTDNCRDSTDSNTLKLWDAESCYKLINLRGFENSVRPVAFSHDGKRTVSGSADVTIKIWNTASPEEVEAELLVEKEGRPRRD